MSKRKNVSGEALRCNLHGKEGRKNEKSYSSSFAELVSLVRMND
jgi:hypothetical protein